MKNLNYYSFIFVLVICSAYKDQPLPILLKGAYGNCGCGEEENSEIQNALFLNENQSYLYNQVRSDNKIEKINGTWTMEKGQIVLSNTKNELRIPDRWKIDENGKCIKGRKGLAFFRLCHIESCKK